MSLAACFTTIVAKLLPPVVPTKNVEELDTPPALVLETVTLAVPALEMLLEVTIACSCVLERKVVAKAFPFHWTTAEDTKFVPVTVIVSGPPPTTAELGLRVVMLGGGGGGVTAKFTLLLGKLPTVTTTFPVVAPLGTGTTMLVSLQLVVGKAGVPLKLTVLFTCPGPKPVPVIVTEVPTEPDAGFRLVIFAAPGVVALAVLE
jgi:hypothetical protein